MPISKPQLVAKHALPFKTNNKLKRQAFHLKQKKARDSLRRDEKFRRKREEDKNPRLREERQARNVPATIDSKRRWDSVSSTDEEVLGLSVDAERLKRRRLSEGEEQKAEDTSPADQKENDWEDAEVQDDEDDADSMLDEEEDDNDSMLDESAEDSEDDAEDRPRKQKRATSPSGSTASTNLQHVPEMLEAKFPTLFQPPQQPKVLITTSINSTLHKEAALLTGLFPHSKYVRRSAHRFGHKFSVREISKFAANRDFTTVLVLTEDQKRPSGLTVVHLPSGPTFHFSISNWLPGEKIPGHGRDTKHYPELILNNFRTPLGLLTAHLFRTMFPTQPELQGRQVVTLHNQRDFIFLRWHRYVFRDKKATEKSVVGTDGKLMKGAEGLKVGLQEIGPRCTLKLRRIDRGIQRASGQEWEWKAGMEKVRTRFNL